VAAAGYVSYRSLVATFVHETQSHQDHMVAMARECIERLWPLPDPEVDRLCKRFPEELTSQVNAGDRPAPEHSLPIRVTVIAADGPCSAISTRKSEKESCVGVRPCTARFPLDQARPGDDCSAPAAHPSLHPPRGL